MENFRSPHLGVMKKIILLPAIFLSIQIAAVACSCNYQGSFLKMSQRTPLVALVKVTKYLTARDIYQKSTPMSMEVEIIEVYKGTETRKTVVVWGDPGHLCRPYLSEFKEGKYYVIAFDKGRTKGGHTEEKETDYTISICGAYWLSADFDKSTVTGDIDSENQRPSTMKLETLKARLEKPTT